MKQKSVLFLSLILIMFSLFYYDAIALAGETPLNSFYKTDYVKEDVVSKALDPNVLFLLDTSTAMTFAPWGIMPNEHDGRSVSERAEMLMDSTYGHGMRPPIFDGVETTIITGGDGASPSTSFSRYGRDLDSNNNVIGSADCYYSSDPNKPFLLTFRNRHLAHYDKWINSDGYLSAPTFGISSNLPNSGVVGTLTGDDWNTAVAEAKEAYSKLLPYIPTRYEKDESGEWVAAPGYEKQPVPNGIANLHLVPNDSRLYKMKLVLWRLTGQTNSKALSRMNVAAAITYQDIDVGTVFSVSVATKNAQPGAIEQHRYYYGSSKTFNYGNAAPYITGQYGDTEDIEGVNTSSSHMSQATKRGVWIYLYQNQNVGDSLWNSLSRSIMYVPFNKFYTAGADGRMNKTVQLDDFRSYISGYENYKGRYNASGHVFNAETRPVKDEFWASSLTLLSTAIYGGRDASEGGNFPFHKGKKIIDNNQGFNATGENMIQFAVTPKINAGSTNSTVILLDPSTNSEGLPTGQAVGSVLDFFSPPTTDSEIGLDGVKFASDSVGFFPVTGSCQQNWLVVFCAGNDAVPGYPPADAVRRLFHKTRTMRGRRFDGSKWVEENYDMDNGVRTIVVGFLPDEKPDEAPEIKKIRADLRAMAKAGDPILSPDGVYIDNPDAEPEIANDVPGLLKAFDNVLRRIHVDKMGSGTISTLPVIDNIMDPNSRVVFGAAYKINNLDQWNGWLGKYILKDNGNLEQWEANRGLINKGLDRALYTSSGRQGAETLDVVKVDTGRLETLAEIPEKHSAKFKNWLLDYEHNPSVADSVGILGDMVHSGITMVGKPKHKSLAGNSAINNRDAVVYVQTNRGVIHALNYMNGNEVWGFIPPNIFQHKLKNLKFDKNDYIDGNGLTRVRSYPMVLLDGMLIAKDVEYQNAARTLLTGYLGYGGNGFYTMDITEMDASPKPPEFRWAIENARYYYDDGGHSVNERVKRWGEAAKTDISNYDYTDLGLTIVPGVYFTPLGGGNDTIGVLPGGLGHKLGKGDTQGKAFYFFNPANGSIMRKIDSSSNPSSGFDAPTDRSLGMGISPIIYYENGDSKAMAFYTADSEGNIMQCNMEGESLPHWKLKSLFQLRTLGTLFPYENGAAIPPAGDLAVAIPRKMLLARSRNNYTWLIGGTSNLYAPEIVSDDSNKLINAEQFIFGLNTNSLLKSAELNMGITPSNGNVRKMPYYIDDIPAKYGKYGQPYNYDNELGINYGMGDYGWVLRLRPKFGITDAEYLSADPYLMNNILYIATFIPYAGSVSEEVCSDIGVSKLYTLDPSTGRSVIRDKPAITLENVKIVGMTGNQAKNRLVLSLKELKVDAKKEIFNNFSGTTEIGNGLFEIDAPGGKPFESGEGNPDFDFEELVPHAQYWSERFR